MGIYIDEGFTEEEKAILSKFFTNCDLPVFALINLPETVKGALFARYSRSHKSLRRLFLDEFYEETGELNNPKAYKEKRAEELYDRVFAQYGDDSVAQLGGAHVACEGCSNLLTKIIERPRLMAYLEQSTRYITYDSRDAFGRYKYYRDTEILSSALGARYVGDIDRIFDAYAEALRSLKDFLIKNYSDGHSKEELPFLRAIKAQALDTARSLLPVAALSNVGIFGSGQAYEMLIMSMLASPLKEANDYAEMILTELKKVIPAFLSRIERPDRGGIWIKYLKSKAHDIDEVVKKVLGPLEVDNLTKNPINDTNDKVKLVSFDSDGEERVLEAILFETTDLSFSQIKNLLVNLSHLEKASIFNGYIGNRHNRRHKPGRAFENTYYTFEITCDYGAFRDLQRHRMLSISWQNLTPYLGYDIDDLVLTAGLKGLYEKTYERSYELYEALFPEFPEKAPYALCLGYNIRFYLTLNAREALHLIELRTQPQAHSSYKSVALKMLDKIKNEAGHTLIADAFTFVKKGEVLFGRLEQEKAFEAKLASLKKP